MRQLLEWGANIELCNYAGLTALMQAAFHGHIHVIDVLLHFGANPHAVRLENVILCFCFCVEIINATDKNCPKFN